MAAALLISQNAVYANAEASGVNAAAQQTETESEEQTAQEIPDADIFDVDFINGTEDKSSLANELGATIGNPVIEMSSELHKILQNLTAARPISIRFHRRSMICLTRI